MGLFGKKENAAPKSCCCGGCGCAQNAEGTAETAGKGASVQILGSGCARCNQLEAATRAALTQLGMDVEIDHVTDFAKIAAYGVMSTPALVVDGKVLAYGKVLKVEEIVALLQQARG